MTCLLSSARSKVDHHTYSYYCWYLICCIYSTVLHCRLPQTVDGAAGRVLHCRLVLDGCWSRPISCLVTYAYSELCYLMDRSHQDISGIETTTTSLTYTQSRFSSSWVMSDKTDWRVRGAQTHIHFILDQAGAGWSGKFRKNELKSKL